MVVGLQHEIDGPGLEVMKTGELKLMQYGQRVDYLQSDTDTIRSAC